MILIATYSQDKATIKPVTVKLKEKGEDALIYYADYVANGRIPMSFKIDNKGEITFNYGGHSFKPKDIEAAWYRRPNVFGKKNLNNAFLVYFDRQKKACQDALWYSIPSKKWLNKPEIMESAKFQNKIYQLSIAHKFGFETPVSIVGNDWKEITSTFKNEDAILKLPNGRLYKNGDPHFFMSTIVNEEQRNRLKNTTPFPGIWQEYIKKKREWRVTVIGNNVFPVAIYTSGKANTDWRKYQFDKDYVQFKAGSLDTVVEQKCVQMLKSMGVRFGAFDIIETEKGDFVFLEVNLSGQYQWLVDELGLEIPDAITDELITIKNLRATNFDSMINSS